MSENKSFNEVKKFHKAFGYPGAEKPTAIPIDIAIKRAVWTAEELVEFLHASVAGNGIEFQKALEIFQDGIDAAIQKSFAVGEIPEEHVLVAQADALTDISYFNYGSFVVAGIDPQPLFDIVQAANMGKLDRETGKPVIRESDGKIMKPDYWAEEFAPEPKLEAEIKRQIKASKLKQSHPEYFAKPMGNEII